jgi:hypothetical protein
MTLGIVACAVSACSGSSSGGLDIPDALPIVQAGLPSVFKAGSAASTSLMLSTRSTNIFDANSDIFEIQNRFFADGPTDFQYRIASVDDRLNEVESRGAACADEAAQEWTVPVGATGLPLTSMYFQCYSEFTGPGSSGIVYFGKKDGYWYLAEFSLYESFELGGAAGGTSQPTMAVLAKISEDSTSAEIYQLAVEKWDTDYHAIILQILADKTAGTFELSTASSYDGAIPSGTSSMYTGLGCGVQMKTDGTNVYATGIFSTADSCGSSSSYCVQAENFTDGAGTCTAINTLGSLELRKDGTSGLQNLGAGDTLKALIVDKTGMPSGLKSI